MSIESYLTHLEYTSKPSDHSKLELHVYIYIQSVTFPQMFEILREQPFNFQWGNFLF
jgi:hypothetical protein